MNRNTLVITSIVLLVGFAGLIGGCDVSADRELRRAEEALNLAMEVSADAHATEDYNDAEAYFAEAQEAAADNNVQEARSLAIKAKLCAEDAERKAKERLRILDSEMDKLGR